MTTLVEEKKKHTYNDYLKTTDDKRYELINGELIMPPSPATIHQRISANIEFELRKFVIKNNLGEVFYAPYDVYFDDENVPQPDILFIARERSNIIGEKNVQGAPDITIEIVSKSSAYNDLVVKKSLYEKFGVMEYWIVIPDEKTIEIYLLEGKSYNLFKKYTLQDTLESPLLKGFRLMLKEIF